MAPFDRDGGGKGEIRMCTLCGGAASCRARAAGSPEETSSAASAANMPDMKKILSHAAFSVCGRSKSHPGAIHFIMECRGDAQFGASPCRLF